MIITNDNRHEPLTSEHITKCGFAWNRGYGCWTRGDDECTLEVAERAKGFVFSMHGEHFITTTWPFPIRTVRQLLSLIELAEQR